MQLRSAAPMLLRLAVSIVAIWALLHAIDIRTTVSQLRGIAPGWILLSGLSYGLCIVIGGLKWRVALPTVPVGTLTYAVLASCFYSVLPTGQLGGEVSKALLVSRRGPAFAQIAASLVFDKLSGVLALLAVGAWALSQCEPPLRSVFPFVLLMATGILLLLIAARPIAQLIQTCLCRFRSAASLLERLFGIADELSAISNARVLTRSLAWGIASHATLVGVYLVLAHGIGMDIAPAPLTAIVVLANIAALIPVSAGGFGLREASLAGLLTGALDMEPTQAVALSVASMAIFLAAALVGGLLELTNSMWRDWVRRLTDC